MVDNKTAVTVAGLVLFVTSVSWWNRAFTESYACERFEPTACSEKRTVLIEGKAASELFLQRDSLSTNEYKAGLLIQGKTHHPGKCIDSKKASNSCKGKTAADRLCSDGYEMKLIRAGSTRYECLYPSANEKGDRIWNSDIFVKQAFVYTACSSTVGGPLATGSAKVADQTCMDLGCSYRQCLKKTYKCDGKGNKERDMASNKWVDRKDIVPTIECADPVALNTATPWKFTGFFLCMLVSVGVTFAGLAMCFMNRGEQA